MPISAKIPVRRISEERFKEIAYQATGAAFDVHNQFGRFFSEKVFKYELANACREFGYEVAVETPVDVTFESFSKTYYVDLLVDEGALFELKSEQAIHPAHENQTLNYLFMLDLNRAKVFNFGGQSLEHQFVSTRLTSERRRNLNLDFSRWKAIDEESQKFRQLLTELLNDWGGFLTLPLYYDALTHFLGGAEVAVRTVEVVNDDRIVTTQKSHLLSPRVAFKLTAFREHNPVTEEHLRRFLNNTRLDAIQWVNLNGHDVEFVTLTR